MKKIFSIFTLAALLLSSNVMSDNVAKVTISGVATEYADLHDALEAGKAAGAVVELLSNVNLTGVTWIPVGTEASPFEGTLDGKNFTIKGLNVEVESSAALIGCCMGNNTVVKNVTFDGATIKATTGNYAAVVIAQWNAKSIENVTVKNSSITATGEKAAGITAGAYIECHNCTVDNCIITCTEQPGAIASYVAGTPIIGCKSLNNTITATVSRAGGLVGKYECDDNGDTNLYKLNNNVVSNCTVTAPDMAGALASQIMGAYAVYEMKNNVLDATLSATKTSPIGILRDGQNAAFTGALAKNITGNWWTDKTYANCQFSYTNVAAGVDEQVIDRGVAKIGDNCFQTLEAAVAAAQAGETIKMIADVDLTSYAKNAAHVINFAANVTLDLNGKTITSNNFGVIYQGTGLVIKNGSFVAANNGSYAIFVGDDETMASATLEDLQCVGGINICKASVTIKGIQTTAQGTNYYAVWADNYAEVSIVSGEYAKGNLDDIVLAYEDVEAAKGTISISGGTFDAQPADKYIATGYKAEKQGEVWVVVPNEEKTEIRDVVANGFATICWAKELVANTIENVEVYSILKMDGSDIVLVQVTENLVAGKPYIVKGTATGKMKAQETGEAETTASNDNGLYGSLAANYNINVDVADTYAFISTDNKYYTIENPGTLTVAKNRAYIRLDEIQAKSAAPGRKCISLQTGKTTPTNIDEVISQQGEKKVILNGRFYIIRGEQLYNACGSLVK